MKLRDVGYFDVFSILLDTLAILTYIMASLFCFLHTLHFRSRYRFLCQVDLLPSLHFEIGLWRNAWYGSARSKGRIFFCWPSKIIHEITWVKRNEPEGGNYADLYGLWLWLCYYNLLQSGSLSHSLCHSDFFLVPCLEYRFGPPFLSPHGTNGFESMPEEVK